MPLLLITQGHRCLKNQGHTNKKNKTRKDIKNAEEPKYTKSRRKIVKREETIEDRLDELEYIVSLLNAQALKDQGELNEDKEEPVEVNQAELKKDTPTIVDRLSELEEIVFMLCGQFLKRNGVNDVDQFLRSLDDDVYLPERIASQQKNSIEQRLSDNEEIVLILCQQFFKDHGCLREFAKKLLKEEDKKQQLESHTQLELPLFGDMPEGTASKEVHMTDSLCCSWCPIFCLASS